MPAFRPTFQWPQSQLVTGVPRLLTSGVSSPTDATDAPSATDSQGGVDRHSARLPNASPRLHSPPPRPVPAGLQHRLAQRPGTSSGAPALDARPDALASDGSRWTAIALDHVMDEVEQIGDT